PCHASATGPSMISKSPSTIPAYSIDTKLFRMFSRTHPTIPSRFPSLLTPTNRILLPFCQLPSTSEFELSKSDDGLNTEVHCLNVSLPNMTSYTLDTGALIETLNCILFMTDPI